ncbi:MAG: twin-arginine translocase TatA/TatE family subunit [Thiotrichales bacterium]|jgi:sec-independent protein translocase protein TatA|nr:twin-arginine translocase TatA/TatE family subunit [Thiotrichales bacterium]MBT3613170.1 twin-arginine translocase TatA/TatE family subunit [Thiotrichales bacterium]MBT3752296.1 twin-arginine translocase TatA/TatE family subunit [Thiotrichales bacterium]MBT3837717.1 twin-arginine translocase TatA/TatE family subunit [Thiotrichales bacterium]MBT4152862.1 twin-arginine translocase TatA/TatE family subunit [Thiotrichales bacterium]
MGVGGIGVWQLLIILVLVILIFGTKKLKNVGGDLGGAIKSFKSAVKGEEKKADDADTNSEPAQLKQAEEDVIEGEKVSDPVKEKGNA